MHIINIIKAHVVRYFKILFCILTYCSCFTTLFPSMPPRAPQGGSRRPPGSPQKHPEKAHIKHFFFSIFFQIFFRFFSDSGLFFSWNCKQPQETPPRRTPEEAPGGGPRRPPKKLPGGSPQKARTDQLCAWYVRRYVRLFPGPRADLPALSALNTLNNV